MATNSKLVKVLEHLVNGEEDKARDLLHQVFIEKARAIHEELMSNDEEAHEEEVDEGVKVTIEDDHVGGTGDEGQDLTNEIKALDDEIDFEQTMSEDGDEDVADDVASDVEDIADDDAEMADDEADMADDAADVADDAAVGADDEVAAVGDKLTDLETALEALKAEFEKLEGGSDSVGDEVADDAAVDSAEDAAVDSAEDADADGEDSWELDEEFDELAESLELEVVEKNMEKSQKTAEDVGAAKSGMSDGNSAKSVVPPSQTSRFGAKPVAIGKGPDVNGFKLEAAPKSGKLEGGKDDNRRKKATDGTKKMSKEGDAGALLNQKVPTDGKMSPLSKGGQNLKS